MKGNVINSGKVGYRFIPKTACTSIKKELYRVEYGREYNEKENGYMHIHHYMKYNHTGDIDNCEFKFIVVRDPIKRFLSAYSNRVVYHKEISEQYIKNNHKDLLIEIPFFNPTIDQFIENIEVYLKIETIKHHFRPFSDFLEGADLSFFDRVYKVENLKELEFDLSKILRTDVVFGREQTGGPKLISDNLSDRQLNKLTKFYERDYNILAGIYEKNNSHRNTLGVTEKKDSLKKSPFIIWTLRRTGGTNLAQTLFEESPYNAVEHEPFNYDRVFGEVTKRFVESKDVEVLRKDIEKILEKRPLIKHCLEIVPQELNLILAELSVKFGYKSIFLYREYAKDRLLSLNYAQTTGVWGKEHKKKLDENPDVFNTPFPVKSMIQHEYICRQKMTGVFNLLISSGIKPIILSFEDLYQHKSYEYSCMLVSDLFKKLGLPEEVATDAFLEKILKRGGQGTKSDYLRFPRADEFVKESANLPRFTLHSELISDVKIIKEGVEINYMECWPVFNGLSLGEIFVSGILLAENPDGDIKIEYMGNPVPGKLNLPSPRIKEMFPNNAASGACRFLVGPILASGPVDLIVKRKISNKC